MKRPVLPDENENVNTNKNENNFCWTISIVLETMVSAFLVTLILNHNMKKWQIF